MKDKSIIELLGEVKEKLEDAKSNMVHWASYASDYSKERWNFDGDIKQADDGITTITEVMEWLESEELVEEVEKAISAYARLHTMMNGKEKLVGMNLAAKAAIATIKGGKASE